MEKLLQDIRKRGGNITAITAQSQSKVDAVRQSWGLTFNIYSDEAHVLADHVRERGLVNVALTERADYKFGVMTQPAVLIMNRQRDVLYTWAVVPTLSNVGGGTDRPVFKDVWHVVVDQMDGRKSVRKIGKHGFELAIVVMIQT